MTTFGRFTLAGLLLAGGLTFGSDATTFGLRVADSARGRGRGCYTLLDDVFATTQPSDALRLTELCLSVTFLGAVGVLALRKRRPPVAAPSA